MMDCFPLKCTLSYLECSGSPGLASTIPGMLTPRGGSIYNVVALQESSGPSLFLPGCQQVLSLFPNPIESTHFTSTATILASPDHVTWTTALSHTASGRMNLDIQISACPSS